MGTDPPGDPGDPPPRKLAAVQDGRAAEDLVEATLARAGWIVVARNWRGGGAEVDLVVHRGAAVRLVEVKARQPGDPSGLDAIGPAKQARLRRAGEAWLVAHRPDEIAFMVALVTLGPLPWQVELIDDAF